MVCFNFIVHTSCCILCLCFINIFWTMTNRSNQGWDCDEPWGRTLASHFQGPESQPSCWKGHEPKIRLESHLYLLMVLCPTSLANPYHMFRREVQINPGCLKVVRHWRMIEKPFLFLGEGHKSDIEMTFLLESPGNIHSTDFDISFS